MLLVKTVLKPSQIQGVGVFADEDIAPGTPVWQFSSGFDLSIDPAELRRLSGVSRDQFMKYAYVSKKSGKFILCFDDARFFNHASRPNICCKDPTSPLNQEDVCVALRRIRTGEELTCDYREFDAGPPEPFTLLS